jgi:CRISPR-associated protein Cas6
MPVIDLAFELRGTSIPLDYGYDLFAALCRVVPSLHGDRRVGVHPIRGIRLEPRRLTLVPRSRLRLRLASEEIAPYLALAGKRLDLAGSTLSVGIPHVEGLRAAPMLVSRLVTIGRLVEPEAVAESLRVQLASLGIEGTLALLPSTDSARAGAPTRRVIRIKGKRLVGYAVGVRGLDADGSLRLLEHGLGSHRRMGCGLFVPAKEACA